MSGRNHRFLGRGTERMAVLSAQVSVYPLRCALIGPIIRRAVQAFREYGLETQVGEMSTLVWGEEQGVFCALREAFCRAAESGDTVTVVTLSNACPRPKKTWA
jgi:uncharacterized protein YqgV (UPF0045/DUF77 family)